MNRKQSTISSLIAVALVFGSLGVSGFVGAVGSLAKDDDLKAALPPKAVERDNDVAPTAPAPSQDIPVSTPPEITPIVTESLIARADNVVTTEKYDLQITRHKLGVHLSKDGLLTGRLNVSDSITRAQIPAENLNIKFVQRGSIVAQVKPGPGGVFQANGLTPGVYSLIASGSDGFFGCGVKIYGFVDTPENEIQDSLQIDMTVVHPSNAQVVQKLIRDRSVGPKMVASRRTQTAQVSYYRAQEGSAPLNTPVLAVGADGKVNTRINDLDAATQERLLAVGATVYLVQRGAVRGRYQVTEDGSFYAPDLVGGHYSLVALSRRSHASFAAIGVVVETGAPATGTVNGNSSRLSVKPVKGAKLQGGSDIDMMPTSDFDSTEDPSATAQQDQSGGFGGGAGGGAGGGGGGFGGGGLGLAAGAAGLAAGVAALANNRHNNPASPAGP